MIQAPSLLIYALAHTCFMLTITHLSQGELQSHLSGDRGIHTTEQNKIGMTGSDAALLSNIRET